MYEVYLICCLGRRSRRLYRGIGEPITSGEGGMLVVGVIEGGEMSRMVKGRN